MPLDPSASDPKLTSGGLKALNAVPPLDVVWRETDTGLRKKGDGVQSWRQLPYEGSGNVVPRMFDPDDLNVRSNARALARRIGHFTPALPTDLTTDAPTVTIGTTQTVTGRYASPLSGLYNITGGDTTGRTGWNTAVGRMAMSGLAALDFMLDGDQVEIRLYGATTGDATLYVKVDGKPMTADPTVVTTTTSTTHYLKLAWGAAKLRRVEVVVAPMALLGVHYPLTGMIYAPPRRTKVAIVSDSFGAGSAGTPGSLALGFTMGRMLGGEIISASVGGSGYCNGGTDIFGGSDRVSQVAWGNPEVIVIVGGCNDDPYSYSTVYAAAVAAYAAYQVACPNVPIVVIGPQPTASSTTFAASRTTTAQALKAASAVSPNVIAYFDMIGTADGDVPAWQAGTYNEGDKVVYQGAVWQVVNGGASTNATPGASNRWSLVSWAYTGTGRVGATASDGSRDVFLYSDSVHPTPAGSRALSTYCCTAVVNALANA